MYARTIVSLIALLSLLISPIAKAGAGVVGYYNELQQIKHLSLDYPLEHRSGTWITFNKDWNTAIRAAVDSDNGDESVVVADKSPYLHYCMHLKNKIFNKIDTVWNKQDGRFQLGIKSQSRLPWERTNYPFKQDTAATHDTVFLRKLDALGDDNDRENLIIAYAKKPAEKVRLTLEAIALDTERKDFTRMQAIGP